MTSTDRSVSAAVGLAVFGLAALLFVSPGLERRVPIARAVAWLGNDYVLVVPIAVLALVATIALVVARRRGGIAEATPPVVEDVAPDPTGRAVDAALDSLPPVRVTREHGRIHERLGESAVGAIAADRGCSRPAARERIEREEWTADPDATAFVAAQELDPPPISRRIAVRLLGDDWFRRRVESTVAALERLEGDASTSAEGDER